jgi:beta-glucosidase-like glycosyl hydrolase
MGIAPFPRLRPGLGVLVPAIRLPADYARVDHFRELAKDGVAGFLVFGGDDELLPPFLKSLRDAAGRPLLVMTDAERGVGQQVLGCLDLPPLLAVGATGSEERAYQHGRTTAIEARALGINMVLAPVADVLSLATNPILGNRSFGSNPDLVAKLVAAWIAGAQEQGVLACAKHFPGHGDTSTDSHAALPVVHADLELLKRRELRPFQSAIAAGVGAIMTAHVVYPALDKTPGLPATLSHATLVDLLRDKMGFGGLVLSDALTMEGVLLTGEGGARITEAEAALRSLVAGCDLLLHPTEPYEVATVLEKAAAEGRVDLMSIDGRLQLTLVDLAVDAAESQPMRAEHQYAAFAMARDSLTVMSNEAGLLPILPGKHRRVFALLIDDDDEPRREEPFRERIADFEDGFVRRTPAGGAEQDAETLHRAEEADLVFLAVACSIRAYKGRAGLDARLTRVVAEVLRAAGGKTIVTLLTCAAAIEDVEPRPPTLVAAWGDAPVCLRAAIDVVLSGGPLRGLDPSGPAGA